MNLRLLRSLICFAALFALVTVAHPAGAQSPGTIVFDVNQYPLTGGGVSYTLRTLLFAGGTQPRLIAPDGTQLGQNGPVQVSMSTFAEFQTRFIGQWTLRETPFGPPGAPLTEYTFTLSPFSLDDVFHETPIVTLPVSGALVPPSFYTEWEFPSGATPGGRTNERNTGVGAVTATFDPFPIQRVRLDVDRALLGATPLIFRNGSFESLSDFVSPLVHTSGPNPRMYDLRANLRNMSLPVTVHVVPEPLAFTLALPCLALVARRARRICRSCLPAAASRRP